MFSQETVLIDRSPEEVYEVLANLRLHLTFWEMLYVPGLKNLDDSISEVDGESRFGRTNHPCKISLHPTRPGAGMVTKIQFIGGELAAEWRIIEEGIRTKVEINIEGMGVGPASNINIRQIAPRILTRLKQHFIKS